MRATPQPSLALPLTGGQHGCIHSYWRCNGCWSGAIGGNAAAKPWTRYTGSFSAAPALPACWSDCAGSLRWWVFRQPCCWVECRWQRQRLCCRPLLPPLPAWLPLDSGCRLPGCRPFSTVKSCGIPAFDRSVIWRKFERAPAPTPSSEGAAEAARSSYQNKEAEYKSQLDALKSAAAAANEEARQAAAAAAAGTGQPGGADGSEADGGLRGRLEAAVQAMQAGLVERDTEVRLLLLAALAGEHILYIGPPGTAKSELGRRLSRLCRGTYFERLLTRFSVPEELFGPLSMRALEEDKYVRQTRG